MNIMRLMFKSHLKEIFMCSNMECTKGGWNEFVHKPFFVRFTDFPDKINTADLTLIASREVNQRDQKEELWNYREVSRQVSELCVCRLI